MPRWPIIRTLLYKEVLRYRYNWGLLVVVFALLALSALISIGSRYKKLPGQASDDYLNCFVMYHPGAAEWAEYLQNHPPQFAARLQYTASKVGAYARLPPDSMVIQIFAPSDNDDPGKESYRSWKAVYLHPDEDAAGLAPYRDWLARETRNFIKAEPKFVEATRKGEFYNTGHIDRVPLIVTAFVIFALYLLSFNLFITSTGEEREKRVLLGLLLSPASAVEVIAAKAIFYASASLVVAISVTCMYEPRLMLNPLLWGAIVSGALGYVAIGTIVIGIVRRQTTINTVSMLYLMMTTIIIFLGQFIPLFRLLQYLLMEKYLYAQLQHVIDNKIPWLWMVPNQIALIVIVCIWGVVAVMVFNRQATAIARAR